MAMSTRIVSCGLALAALVVAFAGTLMAEDKKDEKKGKDEDAILGTWQAEKFDFGGPGGPPQSEVDKIRFVFEKDSVLRLLGMSSGGEMKGTFKLDPAAKVKAFDMTVTRPGQDGKAETMLSVYELDGDTLKICLTEGPNQKRPEEVKADGQSVAVVTFKRVKEEKKKDK
jgi:uncharacterized protein (TIGR03067 family)